MKVYIAHPYGGLKDNKEKVEEFIKKLINSNLLGKGAAQVTYVSPIHSFGYLYDDVDYEKGIDMCLSLLRDCSILIIPKFYKIKKSKGCLMELAAAKVLGIDIKYWEDLEREFTLNNDKIAAKRSLGKGSEKMGIEQKEDFNITARC